MIRMNNNNNNNVMIYVCIWEIIRNANKSAKKMLIILLKAKKNSNWFHVFFSLSILENQIKQSA